MLKNLFGAHVSVRLLEGSMEEVSASHPKPAMTRQQAALSDESKSGIALYRDFAVGEISLAAWLYYEILTVLFSNICGIAGLGLRTLLFPAMFKSCGARPAFGRGMIIRRPSQIALGKKVLLDDYSVLDVRGRDASIEIGDHASIGRFTTVAAKEGHIVFGNGVNIGSYCRVATQTRVEIGESVLVGAYTYIGPGNHQSGRDDEPLISRDMEKKGGVFIGPHVWLGSHVTVLDGVKIGARAVVGAHSLVREDVPEGVVVAGTPARIIKNAF